MTKQELHRLIDLETRITEISKEFGLMTTDILFEVVPAQRVLEGMSYMFPTNFSHWKFGRDYERNRTFYEYTGAGIPYEQVWNFEQPRAFIVETNPFALNVTILAHVFGHVDYFLRNKYLKLGRTYSDVAEEARRAAKRFNEYEQKYGIDEIEKVMDAGMAIDSHQHPDPFFEEQGEEVVRERLIAIQRARLEPSRDVKSEFEKPPSLKDVEIIERWLRHLSTKTPPEPTYDILNYIINNSPKPLQNWQKDILTVIRNQARCLSPNMRTKGLDEGWATYWHMRIVRKLVDEKLLSDEDHGIYNHFNSGVTAEHKRGFNWYRIFSALFEDIERRWDMGRFGRAYEDENDYHKRQNWDTKTGLGKAKIFEVAEYYSDRMAVEEFFTDDFIREQRIYIWEGVPNGDDGGMEYIIVEDNPEIIREQIKLMMTSYGIPQIYVENGDYNMQGQLQLKHNWTGFELDLPYANSTVAKIASLWGRKVFLESKRVKDKKMEDVLISFDPIKKKKN